jgi:hypothetical protein
MRVAGGDLPEELAIRLRLDVGRHKAAPPDLSPVQATAMVERWIASNRVRVALAFAAVVCATIAMRR